MPSGRHQRKLSNVRLTRKFHMRHMGLWMLFTICLVLTLNLFFHLFIQERWNALGLLDASVAATYLPLRRSLMTAQVIETILFCAAIVMLGKLTSHRIAGAFIRLQIACEAVAQGDLDHTLGFRSYDNLDDLAAAFNTMMASIRKRVGNTPPADKPTDQ